MLISEVARLEPFEQLVYWIKERKSILLKKNANKPKPWTDDTILQQYRFCNVHREDDKVTRWIADNWRSPRAAQPDLWFAMVVARLFNLPETLAVLSFPVPFLPITMEHQLWARKTRGSNLFNGAYIVSTNGKKMDKVRYLIDLVLLPMWDNKGKIRPRKHDTLAKFHTRLMDYDGMGSFMAGQVVADIKYVEPLLHAPDWWTFAAPGPGSKRGLNRLIGNPKGDAWPKGMWEATLYEVREDLLKRGIKLHGQDLQNCLCEFDKYCRVLLNEEGRPKQKYLGV